jgi:hypothetical protein
MTRRLPVLLGALAFATAFKLGAGTAEANHVHFGGHVSGHWSGSVHIRGSAYVGGGVHWARPYWRPYNNWSVGGHVWVGGGYYYPRYYWYRPYYYYYYYPSYVPSYYYPVEPQAAAPAVTAAYVPPPPLPRFGIGLFAGGISQSNNNGSAGSSDVGVLARFRIGTGLLVEGELGKTSFDNDVRVDRRLGGSLIYEFGARNSFAPYVLAGIGVNQAQVGNDYNTIQDFAELGVGLRLAITPHIHITADVRAGSRSTVSNSTPTVGPNTTARTVSPPTTAADDHESYTRGRLAAIIYF